MAESGDEAEHGELITGSLDPLVPAIGEIRNYKQITQNLILLSRCTLEKQDMYIKHKRISSTSIDKNNSITYLHVTLKTY